MLQQFRIEKILSENLASTELISDTLYLVKDGDTVSMKLTGNGTDINNVSENVDIPCLYGNDFCFAGLINSYYITNYDVNKDYVITSLNGEIQVARDENILLFTYNCFTVGQDILTVNDRKIPIDVMPFPDIDPVTISVVSGTNEQFDSPFTIRVSEFVSSIPMTKTNLTIYVSETGTLTDAYSVIISDPIELSNLEINLTQKLGSIFKPIKDYYINAVYTGKYKNSTEFTGPGDTPWTKVTTVAFPYPTYIYNTTVQTNLEERREFGWASDATSDLSWVMASKNCSDYGESKIIVEIYKRMDGLVSYYSEVSIDVPEPTRPPELGTYARFKLKVTDINISKDGQHAVITTIGCGTFLIELINDVWTHVHTFTDVGSESSIRNRCFINSTSDTVIFSVIEKYIDGNVYNFQTSYVHVYKKVNNTWTLKQTLSEPTFPDPGTYPQGNFGTKNGMIYPFGYFGSALITGNNDSDLFIGSSNYNVSSGQTEYINNGIVFHYTLVNGNYQFNKIIENPNKHVDNPEFGWDLFNNFGNNLEISSDSKTLIIGSQSGVYYYNVEQPELSSIISTVGARYIRFGEVYWLSQNGDKLYITAQWENNSMGSIYCYMKENGVFILRNKYINTLIDRIDLALGIYGNDVDSYTIGISSASKVYDSEQGYYRMTEQGQIIELM